MSDNELWAVFWVCAVIGWIATLVFMYKACEGDKNG